MKKYYTIYSNKTDEVVAFGDSLECCKKLGLKDLRQFYAFVSKTKSGIRKGYSVVVEELSHDDEET
jgi:hypothetical protein